MILNMLKLPGYVYVSMCLDLFIEDVRQDER